MAEAAAIALLKVEWGQLPPAWTMGEFFLKHTRMCRMGAKGRMHVDGAFVRGLVAENVPMAGLVKEGGGPPANVVERFCAMRVGRLVLVRRMDVADLVMVITGASPVIPTDRRAITKTSPAYVPEHAA